MKQLNTKVKKNIYASNIGLVPEFLMRDNAKSGIDVYSISLISELCKIETPLRFTVFISKDCSKLLPNLPDNFRLVLCKKPRNDIGSILWYFFMLPLHALKHKIDILHLFSGNRRLTFYACRKTVVTVHDVFHYWNKRMYGFKQFFFFKFFILLLLKRQKYIVSPSDTTASEIQEILPVVADNITVVKQGYSIKNVNSAKEDKLAKEVRQKYSLANRFMLYVSCLDHPRKNHVRLIRAYEKLNTVYPSSPDLVFIGSEFWNAEGIYFEIQKSAVKNSIKILGFIPDEELSIIYRSAEIFVHPSTVEGFGLPLLEAMSSGLPLACSNITVFHEVCKDAALYFNPFNPDDIASKLKLLLENKSVREALRAKGLERSIKFGWDKTAHQMEQLYRKALFAI